MFEKAQGSPSDSNENYKKKDESNNNLVLQEFLILADFAVVLAKFNR